MSPWKVGFLQSSLHIKLICFLSCDLRISQDVHGHQRDKCLWEYSGHSWFGDIACATVSSWHRSLHPLWNVSQGLVCTSHLPFILQTCTLCAEPEPFQFLSVWLFTSSERWLLSGESKALLHFAHSQILLVGEANDLQFNVASGILQKSFVFKRYSSFWKEKKSYLPFLLSFL